MLTAIEDEYTQARSFDQQAVARRNHFKKSWSIAGIPVRGASGVGGGFEIMQEYKIDNKVFSTTDLSALLMGLSSLSNMVRGDELVHALAKVKSFIPADRAKEIELKVNQICIDLSPWTGNCKIQPYLEIIKSALQENKQELKSVFISLSWIESLIFALM